MGLQKRQRDNSEADRPIHKKRKQIPTSHSLAIASYHTNEKQTAQAFRSLQGNPVALFRAKQTQSQLEEYQDASLKGASSHGETSKWLAKELRQLRPDTTLKLLDVGALSGTAYQAYDFIEATSIDLNPRGSAGVIKADFFSYPVPLGPEEAFDCVALSLVLNFVGDLQKRGDMLRLSVDHLKPDGMLYLVLPLACVANSRFIDHIRLQSILKAAGFDVLKQHDSARLTYWLCQRSETPSVIKRWHKRPIESKQQASRNNFAIVLSAK